MCGRGAGEGRGLGYCVLITGGHVGQERVDVTLGPWMQIPGLSINDHRPPRKLAAVRIGGGESSSSRCVRAPVGSDLRVLEGIASFLARDLTG
jgi:hypothetical protein